MVSQQTISHPRKTKWNHDIAKKKVRVEQKQARERSLSPSTVHNWGIYRSWKTQNINRRKDMISRCDFYKTRGGGFGKWSSLSSQKGSIYIARVEINFPGFGEGKQKGLTEWCKDREGSKSLPGCLGYKVWCYSLFLSRQKSRVLFYKHGEVRKLAEAYPMWCWFVALILKIIPSK